jgi:hypothetical protein
MDVQGMTHLYARHGDDGCGIYGIDITDIGWMFFVVVD